MSISPWTLYWLLRLDGIKEATVGFIGIAGTITALCLMAWFICSANEQEEMKKISGKAKRNFYFSAPVLLLLIIIQSLIPTTKQMAAIVVVPAIVNSDAGQRAQQIPEKLLQILEIKLEELIDGETKPQEESK